VEAGEEIEVFKDNHPVAKIVPFSRRRQWLPVSEIGRELERLGPDTTCLAEELRAALTETTDDLPW
jgi:antitoxin (DNA-binding transcriptional repressor) of toxin-antitoxin stability system